MTEAKLSYVSTAHSQAGSGVVAIKLQREDGGTFHAILNADDARRLLDDLPEQVRIATFQATSRGR
jgi:hypothetical protein